MPLYGYVALLVQANLLISSALSGFCAQLSRPTTSFCATMSPYDVVRISDKRGSKSPKKPPNRSFLLGVAVQSDLRGGSMSPRLFLQQNTAKPEFYPLSKPPYFAFFGLVGVISRSCSQIATQGILVAYTGIFTAEKNKELTRRFYIRSFRHLIDLECISYIFLFC